METMDTDPHIGHHVTRTLELLDQPDALPPGAGFSNRILSRISASTTRRTPMRSILRPALLTSIVLANIAAALWTIGGESLSHRTEARQELLEMLSTDLNIPADDQYVTR
jgi:hypothetical protein